jgi:hypothetical protein
MIFQLVPFCTSAGRFIGISGFRGAEVEDCGPLVYDTLKFAGGYLYFGGSFCFIIKLL